MSAEVRECVIGEPRGGGVMRAGVPAAGPSPRA